MSVNTYLAPSPVTPPFLTISNITKANPMVVTVVEANSYVVGQLCTLTVPSDYGMYQVNEITPQITAISGQNFTMNVDSTQFDTFTNPPSSTAKPATLAPGGSRNIYNSLAVPFHSVNGSTGN